MQTDIRHYGRIENGKKIYYNQSLYDSQIQALEKKEFVEVIKQVHKKPSVNSYNYYRGGILPTCYQSEMFCTLNNKDEVHTLYFAPKFLSYKVMSNIGGKQIETTITRSLADLNQEEMTEFISKVKNECRELEIPVGEPQDYYSKFYNK